MPIYVPVAAAMVVGSIIVLVWTLSSARPLESVQTNLTRGSHVNDSRDIALSASARIRLLDPMFASIGRSARAFTGRAAVDRTQRKLELAGLYDTGWTVERILVIRLFSLGIGITCGFATLGLGIDRNTVLMAVLIAGLGVLAPSAWLARRVNERQGTIERQLPDVIDQLTVSVEAGLGFDAAMARSAGGRPGPLTEELSRVLQDLQVGVDRQAALDRMVARTDVADLRQFVVAVRQATKHGLPIGRILKVQSQELREKRRARVEEKAASLPVKIVFPLVFCILPSLFVVILGPAVLDTAANF